MTISGCEGRRCSSIVNQKLGKGRKNPRWGGKERTAERRTGSPSGKRKKRTNFKRLFQLIAQPLVIIMEGWEKKGGVCERLEINAAISHLRRTENKAVLVGINFA